MKHSVITIKADFIMETILTPVTVSDPKAKVSESEGIKSKPNAVALIDTGSSTSSISDSFAAHLGLEIIGQGTATAAGGEYTTKTHLVDILLQNREKFTVKVSEFVRVNQGFDIVIGMDILTQGDLAITNCNHQTVVSFRVPSGTEHIDFRLENNED